jgi:3-hydroxyisobutyrate dehydrogenase-like beta-hydroxyacid dehydrogenase
MSRRTKKNVGLIGLGIIGSRVRDVLRKKGFHVFVWNRTPRPVPNFVGAPAELAEMCDFIQIFVSDDEALLEVAKQLSPGLAARHVVIAHSTVAPHSMVAAAEIIQRRGARFLEAPFTGSKEAAENGQLVYYVGGDEAALGEARPILEASSREIMIIGEVGQATAIKIATNMVTAATVQATAEGLALMQATGLPLEKFVAAMKGNASNSKTLDLKLPKMVAGNFEPHFSVKHMLKDMQIASRLGLSQHLELGVTSAARDRLLEQMQRGHGDEDYSAVVKKYFTNAPKTEAETETELELFEPRPAAPVEAPWVDLTINHRNAEVAPVLEIAPVPEAAPETEIAPVLAEAPAQPMDVDVAPIIPAPIETMPENEQEHQSFAESGDMQTDVVDEPEQRRGFFGRFLRRESNG